MKRIVLISLVAVVFVGCQDGKLLTDTGLETPIFAISDGINDGSQGGGNVDVFFLPPLVVSPGIDNSNGDFGDRDDNGDLEGGVVARICELDVATESVCETTLTPDLPMLFDSKVLKTVPGYNADWKTRDFTVTNGRVYRIQIFLEDFLLAFRHVRPVAQMKGKAEKCSKVQVEVCDFENRKNGATVTINVSIESGAGCLAVDATFFDGNAARPCTTVFAEKDETVELPGVATATPTNTGGAVNFQPCVDLRLRGSDLTDAGIGRVDLKTFGVCVEIIPLTDGLEGLATLCDPFTPAELGAFTEAQIDRMTVHRHTVGDDFAFALAHADADLVDCAPSAPAQALELNTLERFVRFARNTWRAVSDRVVAWIEPAPLFARTMFRCNRGGCSGPGGFRSSYMVVQPAKMDFDPVGPAGDLGSALVNTTLTARLKVTDAGDVAVEDARLTFSVTGGGGLVNGGAGPVVVFSNSSGIAEVTVTLGPNPGPNTWEASGIGIGVGAVLAPLPGDPDDAAPVELSVGTLEFRATATEPNTIFLSTFTADALTASPGSPEIGSWTVTAIGGTILVQSSLGNLTTRPVVLDKTVGGAVTLEGTVAGTPPTDGLWLVRWRSVQIEPGGGGVATTWVLRASNGSIIFTAAYTSAATVQYNGNAKGAFSSGVSQLFEIVVDLDNKKTSLFIDGVPVASAQDQAFVAPTAPNIEKLSVSVSTDPGEFGWDDIEITEVVIIDFETFPGGNPACDGCVITNQFASFGVTFSGTPNDVRLRETSFFDLLTGNHSVTTHSFTTPFTMTFPNDPTTVQFTLRGNNTEAVFPVSAIDGLVISVPDGQITRSGIFTYVITTATFRQETVTVTSPDGISSITIGLLVFSHWVDDLVITQ